MQILVQCGHYIVKNDQIIEVVHGDGKMESYDSEMAVIEIMNDEKINSFVWDKLYKKELFHGFKYMELDYHEDVASTFKLIAKSKRVVCNNKPLYYYIRNPKSISHTLNPYKYYCLYRAFKEREEII